MFTLLCREHCRIIRRRLSACMYLAREIKKRPKLDTPNLVHVIILKHPDTVMIAGSKRSKVKVAGSDVGVCECMADIYQAVKRTVPQNNRPSDVEEIVSDQRY